MIKVKRVYDSLHAGSGDGRRFLVDRLWPRGVKKEALQIDGWIKEAAPSNELRKWFSHDPDKWSEFKRRYQTELNKSDAWRPLLEAARRGNLTLLYSAKDEQYNNAVALKSFLDRHLK